MQTVSIEARKYKRRDEIEDFLKEKHLSKGDKVEISTEGLDSTALGAILVFALIAIAFVFISEDRKRKRHEYADNILEDLFQNMDIDELEKQIENEFGVDINVQGAVDAEREAWFNIGMQNFNSAYSENEPDYSDVIIKEPNPDYKP